MADEKKMVECPDCDGNGSVICAHCMNGDEECCTCDGTGEIEDDGNVN